MGLGRFPFLLTALATALLLPCFGLADDRLAPKGSFRELRFSQDGRYVLAQDDYEITVLTVQPFGIAFRIPAEHAELAKFTPDSHHLTFVSPGMHVLPQGLISRSTPHVERWSLADQILAESVELRLISQRTEELSPDGRFLVSDDDQGTLRILDVASGETVLERKRFVKLYQGSDPQPGRSAVLVGNLGFINISFSTDSRFVVVWGEYGGTLGWDLRGKVALTLERELRSLKKTGSHFVFLTENSVLIDHSWGYARGGYWHAKVLAFPSGEVLSRPRIPIGKFYWSTYPGFVLVRPFGRFNQNIRRSAAANLSTGEVIISDGALDVFDHYYVAELESGKQVGLYEMGKGLQATVAIHGK